MGKKCKLRGATIHVASGWLKKGEKKSRRCWGYTGKRRGTSVAKSPTGQQGGGRDVVGLRGSQIVGERGNRGT